ncbi:MAG TPA: GxxExxY protein [bacterium]|nr:GxxExxY protein [bacterium]
MDFAGPNKSYEEIDPETDRIAKEVVDSAYQVHLNLGPGLLENAYEVCLAHEISQRGLKVEQQVAVPLNYKGARMNVGFRLDLLVADRVVVEIKAVEQLAPVHRAQVITYLKLSDKKLGFLINFNESILKNGLERIALSKPRKS